MAYQPVIDTIDLGALPPPDVVETLTYQAIYAANLEVFAAIEPNYELYLPSDPVVKLIQAFSYREYRFYRRVNAAAEALLIAKSSGNDLENLVARHGVVRQRTVVDVGTPDEREIVENDASLKKRYLLKMDALSGAGPSGAYEYWARTATAPLVTDVKAISPAKGEVLVSLISYKDDMSVGIDTINKVYAALSKEERMPLTDYITVQGAQVLNNTIVATLSMFSGPDPVVVLATAKAALDKLIAEYRVIGRDLPRAAIIAALTVGGVQNVNLIQPAADITVNDQQVFRITSIDVTTAGVGE